jgi:hypothetical protein
MYIYEAEAATHQPATQPSRAEQRGAQEKEPLAGESRVEGGEGDYRLQK